MPGARWVQNLLDGCYYAHFFFFRQGSRSTEKLNNLPKATQEETADALTGRPMSKDGEPKPGYRCPDEARRMRGTRSGRTRTKESGTCDLGGSPITVGDHRGWLPLRVPIAACIPADALLVWTGSQVQVLSHQSQTAPSMPLPRQVQPSSIPTEQSVAPGLAGLA